MSNTHYNIEELVRKLVYFHNQLKNKKIKWLNEFSESNYFKEDEGQDHTRVVSRVLSEARQKIKDKLKENGIDLSVEALLPTGAKKMQYSQKKIRFQGLDPFYEVVEGVLAVKGLHGIILSRDGTEIEFIPNDFEGELNIPEGITKIWTGIFEKCGRITSIKIPKSITSIAGNIFFDWRRLEHIEVAEENPIYKSVDGILFNKEGTKIIFVPRWIEGSLFIPEGVTEIGRRSFWGCIGLTSVTIPASVTRIKEGAFRGCMGLTSITIPATVTEIEQDAFARCARLTVLTIPMGVIKIGCFAFYRCHELTSITLPEGITEIEENTFAGCCKLAAIGIPKSVSRIEESAFEGCSSLISITLPEKVAVIREDAFKGCTKLQSIQVATENPVYKSENGVLFSKKDKAILLVPNGVTGGFQIPEGITKIGKGAFRGCSRLTEIIIPESVKEIEEEAFWGCSELTSIVIPKWVSKIRKEVFCGCHKLTNITLSKSVTKISQGAFEGCSNLINLTIPERVTEIVLNAFMNAFKDCTSLESIQVATENPVYKSENGVLYSKKAKAILLVPSRKKGAFQITNGIVEIGDNAFSRCSGLIDVIIPESVNKIGIYAFQGCKKLNSITIPKSVREIGEGVFYECDALKTIEVAKENPIFKSLNGILLNKEGTKIIFVPEGIKGDITIPEGVTEIGESAFRNCTRLTSITLPDSVSVISTRAFQDCTALTNVKIPKNVTEIKQDVFSRCRGLINVIIPEYVTKICWGAFEDCTSLKGIYFEGNAPRVLNSFENVHATVYYRKGTKGWEKTLGGLLTKEIEAKD